MEKKKRRIIIPVFCKTDIENEADIKVYISEIRSEADIIVYETSNVWDAVLPHVWCYTNKRSEADKLVSFTDMRWNADIVIFLTEIQSDGGWINSGKSGLI